MTFTIPVWIFWALGILVGTAVLVLAVVGGLFLWAFRDGIYK